MTDCRRFLGSAAAVVMLSRGAHCFVAHGSLRFSSRHVVGSGPHHHGGSTARVCGSDGRQQSQGAHAMTARGVDEAAASSSAGAMDRKQLLSKVWKAALSLSAFGAAAVATGGATPAEAGIGQDIGGFLLPSQNQPTAIVVGESDKEVSFEDFERALLKGEVARCEFFGPNFDKAIIVLKDGTRALIGEGYPEERAFSDDSPMKVVGLLRNAGVPFTTEFRMAKYSKPKSYKSSETLEAENRQKSEDAALDRLMEGP
ncbi:unnamed protein product [Ectocarpus sp. 8 AP-2014]